MNFDAIRQVACMKRPSKKLEPKAAEPSQKPPPAKPADPTPAPPPSGPPPQGPGVPPHMGHCTEVFENVPACGDPNFGYREHSRTWKLGLQPNYPNNYSCQDYEGQNPVPQEYYRSCYGNPRMNSRENYRQIGYYPDHSMGNYFYPDDTHCSCESRPGYITNTTGGHWGIGGPPSRLALPTPDRYMDDYYDSDHYHGHRHHAGHYGCNHQSPRIREFGPATARLPTLPRQTYYDPYHCSGASPRGVAQYYLPSTYDNCFSDENTNGCSVM